MITNNWNVKAASLASLALALAASIPATSSASNSTQQTLNALSDRPDLPFPKGLDVQSICGPKNDLVDVAEFDGLPNLGTNYLTDYKNSTVQIQWLGEREMEGIAQKRLFWHHRRKKNVFGVRWCTGTLISDTLVLTAGHCFETQRGQNGWYTPKAKNEAGSISWLSPQQLAPLMRVNFRYQKRRNSPKIETLASIPVGRLVEDKYSDGGLDYAIVELATPISQFGQVKDGNALDKLVSPAKISFESTDQDMTLAMIQHPGGQPKKIGSGTLGSVSAAQLTYANLDTLPASSGSAIRNSQRQLIGVHTQGGCDRSRKANAGIPIKAIRDVSPTIANLGQGG